MARLDGQRRAPFFDSALYTEATRETYARKRRRFLRAASEAEIIALDAPRDWVMSFFMREAMRSLTSARKQIPAVAEYFRANGRADDFPYDEVLDLLRETSALAADPVGARFEAGNVPRPQRHRARAFAGNLMKQTRKVYAAMAQLWEVYARRYHIDPLHPTWQQLRGFLSVYARTHRYRSVCNLCSALSNYFRAARVPDGTRDEHIRDLLAVLAREDATTTKYRALYSEDLASMVRTLGTAVLDVRDRCVLLLTYYGTFFATDLGQLDRNVTLRDDGVDVLLGGQTIFVGGVDDPDLDVRKWMPLLLDALPKEPGPLFCGMNCRGDWKQTPLTPQALCKLVRRAERRANINVAHPTLALRRGFAIRVGRVVGRLQTAVHMRLKKVTSLDQHLGPMRARKSRTMASLGV